MDDREEELRELEAEAEEEPVPQPPPELRVIGLFGEVAEKKSEDVVYALLMLAAESKDDIDMFVSSTGGAAIDMFAIYDVMRLTRDSVDISTIGIGKVMSAAVILMAAML